MNYANILDQMISDSGLSLRNITKRCKELDCNITPSYISQLKNGKLSPPSEDVSTKLSIVCGEKNPTKLVFQGYLEKAPEMVRKYIFTSSFLLKDILENMLQDSSDFTDKYGGFLNNLDIISTLDLSAKYLESIKENNFNKFMDELDSLSGNIRKESTQGDSSFFFIRDTAMEPIISINAHIKIVPTNRNLLKNRDIVAFHLENSKMPLVRRYYKENGVILLIPENKDSEIYVCKSDDEFYYLGKVISFKMNF
ncbi:MAG: S24 family peptidase [Peptostreptococcales bacterium]|jgi:hypothetical protein